MRTTVILILFVITFGICYAEEPTTERPTYSAGDYWVFTKGEEEGKDIKIEFLREEKDQYIFRENGEEYATDFNLTSIKKKKDAKEYPGPIIKFPLKIGKWWEYDFETKGGTEASAVRGVEKKVARYKVEGYEEITVPPGTFWAFKISVDKEIIYKRASKSVGSATYWYAPSVKQIIKSIEKKTSELKEYKIQ